MCGEISSGSIETQDFTELEYLNPYPLKEKTK
jgi:hypothetical protein